MYVDVVLTQEMIEVAKASIPKVRVNRTVASPIDTLTGLVGEFAFAEWFFGDWHNHKFLETKGRSDILGKIEVKTSAFPFRETLNLLVREDYALKRKPEAYVQVVVDTPIRNPTTIEVGWIARLSGWATSLEVDAAPLKDFGSRMGGNGGYLCRYIPINKLHPMDQFSKLE